jgi:hypothetical protein
MMPRSKAQNFFFPLLPFLPSHIITTKQRLHVKHSQKYPYHIVLKIGIVLYKIINYKSAWHCLKGNHQLFIHILGGTVQMKTIN